MSHDNPDLAKKGSEILERLAEFFGEDANPEAKIGRVKREVVIESRDHLRAILDAVPEVLVLDDQDLVLRSVGRIFKSMKPNSREAVTTIADPLEGEAHIGQMPVFSMVVSDNQMGALGYTGAEIAERLHPVTQAHRLTYAINSSDSASDFDHLIESGAIDAFFPKNVYEQANLQRLAEIFVRKVQTAVTTSSEE